MKLKRLTLHGFKSFADRTEFCFDDGLTGIIGPNGCGKSNVVDAVKWVLGDQRPTSLRGKEMVDVIFNGAQGRAPMGCSEVRLILEREPEDEAAVARANEVARLPGAGSPDAPSPDAPSPDASPQDASSSDPAPSTPVPPESDHEDGNGKLKKTVEMSVGRRLYRSGESEYLINGRVVRLKDVKEALLGTGLGVGGYSVMEQGKIDAVLSANPEDRRNIFDEAAGISLYKLRRKEALRKLDRTEQNLARISDVRQEKASRVRSLKIQATRARNYREAESRLRALRVAISVLDSQDFQHVIAGIDRRLVEAEEGLEKKTAARDEARERVQDLEQSGEDLAERRDEARELLASLRAEARSRREALDSGEQRLLDLKTLVGRSEEEHARLLASIQKQSADFEDLKDKQGRLAEEAAAVDKRLPELETKAREARSRVKELRTKLERTRNKVLESIHERTRARNQVQEHGHLRKGLEARRLRLSKDMTELRARITESRRAALKDKRIAWDLEERLARIEDQLEAQKTRTEGLAEDRRLLLEEVQDLSHKRSALRSQIRVLEELEASHEGLDDAAREVLEGIDGIRGTLTEHIDCPLEVGPALESVLGSRVEALLADGPDSVRAALTHLATRGSGGHLFLLDLGGRSSGQASEAQSFEIENLPAEGLPLASLCSFDAELAPFLMDFLDGVQLVRDLASAREVEGQHRLIVTLDGEVLEGPWVRAGRVEASAGLVQRRSTLAELAQEQLRLDAAIEEREQRARDFGLRFERWTRQLGRLDRLQQGLVQRQGLVAQALRAREARETELEEELQSAELEQLATADEERELLAGLMKPLLNSLLLERMQGRREEEQRNCDREIATREQEVAETQKELSAAQTQKAAAKTGLEGLEERRRILERAAQENAARKQELETVLARARNEQEELKVELRVAASERVEHECRAGFVDGLSKKIEAEHEGLLAETREARRELESVESALEAARDQRGEIVLEEREARFKLERLDREIYEAYRIELGRLRGEIHGYGMWSQGPILGPELPLDSDLARRVFEGAPFGPPLAPDHYEAELELERLWLEDDFDRRSAEQESEVLRSKIQRMGAVNLAAVDELKSTEEEFETLERDCRDLEASRKQLMETLHRINLESRSLFEQTFETARKHFQEIFRMLFQGGSADIRLTDSEDPLEAGIDIYAKPPGKELQSIRLLSGGERSMTALAILFAVFKVKPSPFCILDEVDAALDETNVERFLRVLDGFVEETQFLVVTHHKRTMADCQVLYGVTMPRRGISSHMSVSLADVESGTVDRILDGSEKGESSVSRTQRPVRQSAADAVRSAGTRATPGRSAHPSARPSATAEGPAEAGQRGGAGHSIQRVDPSRRRVAGEEEVGFELN